MGAPSKRAKRIRRGDEFDSARLQKTLDVPRGGGIPLTSWTLSEIFSARDAQLRGDFQRAARMAESMRTDEALAVPLRNRLSPMQSIKVRMKAGRGASAERVRNEAEGQFGENGLAISADTIASIHECLTNHEVAFACINTRVRADGARTDFEISYWPIEFVRWDPYHRVFKTRVDPATVPANELPPNAAQDFGSVGTFEVPIVHGDGRWIVFQRYENEPFKHGAILAAAIIWARHAYALRDWAKSSVAHGNSKVIGTLPEGVALQDENGNPTEEAQAMAELLRGIATSDSPVGIKPAKSTVDFIVNNGTAWQVFAQLVQTAEKSGARLYQGTDAALGSQGGAPGVNIEALFGVARTYVQSDLACIKRGLQTGAIEPWTAINFGDSALAPERDYVLPDEDEDAMRESERARTEAFYAEIERARANGFQVDQPFVDLVATKHGIPAPKLPEESKKAPTISLAPTDIARVVTVNEARASAGVGPLARPDGSSDPDGGLTVEQFASKKKAEAEAEAQVVKPAAPAQPLTLTAEIGRDGRDGVDGMDGAPGHDGNDGVKGEDGKDGAPGRDGHDGKDGKDGKDGAPGRDGHDGKDGAPGRDGAQGPAGPPGPVGPQGVCTCAPSITAAKVLTFAERNAAFLADLKDHQTIGLCVDQTQIDQLAKLHGVPAPRLASE